MNFATAFQNQNNFTPVPILLKQNRGSAMPEGIGTATLGAEIRLRRNQAFSACGIFFKAAAKFI